MNKFNMKVSTLVLSAGLSLPVFAGGSSQHFSDALANSGQAIAHSTIGGLKLVSGVVALPLLAIGEIGNVSGQMGEELWEEANRPINEPLPITDDVVTIGPSPAEAIERETVNRFDLGGVQ